MKTSSTIPQHPLVVEDSPATTLENCSCAIRFLAYAKHNHDGGEDMADDGLHPLLMTIDAALRFEEGRVRSLQSAGGSDGQRPQALSH